jgi:nitronate monooxygenase
MPFKTALTELTGAEVPLMCGGMHYVGFAELVAAVANAGAFGCITALTQPTPDDLRKEIQKCRTLTNRPFGVNITLLPVSANPDYDGYCRVIIEEGIKVVETAGSAPQKYVKIFKDAGLRVIHKCTSVRHAKSAIKVGVDMISMDGFECGGHPGGDDVTNWVLIPKACRVLSVPIIVSGACADGRQLAAALAMGAHGMNMGTRWMATQECGIHANIKKALVNADERQTTLVMRSLGNTERVFKNKTAEKVRELEAEHPGEFEYIRPYVAGLNYRESFWKTGDETSSVWSCGQSIGLIDDVPTCAELVSKIMKDCEQALRLPQCGEAKMAKL